MNDTNGIHRLLRPAGRLATAIAATLGLFAVPSVSTAAAPAAAPATELEEVTVTASKREESLHDVPLSVAAISADTIESAGITSFLDYATKIPNLTFSSGHGVVEGRSIAIRGVQGSSTTGFYIDDMPVPPTVDPRAVDLARIEVLRGPQGTLYGARSMGGTMRLITETPDFDAFSAKLHGTLGDVQDGGSTYQIDGTINAPLVKDRLALRVTGYGGRDGSFLERSFPTTPGGADMTSLSVAETEYAGGIASMLWKVTDNFTVRPTVLMQYSRQDGLPLADTTADSMAQIRTYDIPELVQDKWTYGGITLSYATPVGDITSVSSWFSRDSYEVEDVTEVLAVLFGLDTPLAATMQTWQPRHSFIEELRFSSRFSGPAQFIGGVFIQRQKYNYNQYSEAPGLDDAFGGYFGSDVVYTNWHPTETDEDAIFGELTWQFSDRWSAVFGARYSKIDTATEVVQSGPGAGGFPGGKASASENSTTPKVVLKYEANPDLNYYLLAAKGFRPGGPQVPPPPTFCAGDYEDANLTPEQLSQYKSDSLWNYEVGAKTRLLDRRLSLNVAAFWIDWKDLQQNLIFSCGYSYRANVGAARSRGAEVEISATPTDGLTLTAGIGYTDAEITESSDLVATPVGAPIQQIAPWTVSLAVDYSFPLSGDLRGLVRADYGYVDHSFSASNDVENPRLRPSYNIANLRAGVTAGRWEVIAFVNNVTNEHANLGDNQSQAAEMPGRPRILVNPPRTYGIEATMRW